MQNVIEAPRNLEVDTLAIMEVEPLIWRFNLSAWKQTECNITASANFEKRYLPFTKILISN